MTDESRLQPKSQKNDGGSVTNSEQPEPALISAGGKANAVGFWVALSVYLLWLVGLAILAFA